MKQDIDSILIANYYLIKCKLENPSCQKTSVARQYLTAIIKKALIDRTTLSGRLSKKAISIF